MCEPERFHGSYLPGIAQVKLSATNVIFETREVNGRLCIEEVGVDLELSVHAHGHDVDLIMEASLKLIIPLV